MTTHGAATRPYSREGAQVKHNSCCSGWRDFKYSTRFFSYGGGTFNPWPRELGVIPVQQPAVPLKWHFSLWRRKILRHCQKKVHNTAFTDLRVDFRFKMQVWNKNELRGCLYSFYTKKTKIPLLQAMLCTSTHFRHSLFYIITHSFSAFSDAGRGMLPFPYFISFFSSLTPLWPHSSAAWSAIVPPFPTPLTRVHQWLHLKIGFKVHIGWTQLATSVAVETRLTHGQVVENRVSGSLRGYRGLSRFMDFTAQFDRPSGNLSSKRGKNIRFFCADTAATRRTSPDQRHEIS